MYSGSCIEHCQSNSSILFCSNPLKTNNQTGILMDYRQIHAEEREEWTLNTLQHFIQLYSTAHWIWSLLQVVGPRLLRKNTLFLKYERFFHFATQKNTSFMQKRNMNTVDLSVSSPTDGGDVELHVLGCATSTFTQLLNSGLYPWWWWWCRASCPRMSVDILGTNCEHCLSMVQCCLKPVLNWANVSSRT